MDSNKKIISKFQAFSLKQISETAILIKVMQKNSISIDSFLNAVDMLIMKKGKEINTHNSLQNNKNTIKKIKCPSCKKGYLLPTLNYEGLNIVSCKKCRYSTILEEEIENG